jgi:FixJ family two-component response regulator
MMGHDRAADPGRSIVLIVDDDAEVRTALHELLFSVGIEAAAFGSTSDCLASGLIAQPGCLILDVRMPGSSGLDLQNHLTRSGNAKPIIFLSGHGDIPMTVQAMKAGAVDFLTKPFRDQTLLDAVALAHERDRAQRLEAEGVTRQLALMATLTPRERQVLSQVVRGRLNKQIAFDLGVGQITVKFHRGNVMRKMQAGSVGELIRAWEILPAEVRAGRS